MKFFEEIKSISGEDGSEDSKFIAPFPLLSKNVVESLRYRAAKRSWTTSKSTAKTAMLDLEKIPTVDTHPIPFVSDKPLTYGGAVGSPSELNLGTNLDKETRKRFNEVPITLTNRHRDIEKPAPRSCTAAAGRNRPPTSWALLLGVTGNIPTGH